MQWGSRDEFHVAGGYQPLMRELGLDAEAVFTHPDIRVWRDIAERENAILEARRPDGSPLKLHVKRYRAGQDHGAADPAAAEANGIQLLQQAGIPTVPLVAWGRLRDGRSFVLTEDLAGFEPADKALARGIAFSRLASPLAHTAARLHDAGLHHRDLYLCHFFVHLGADGAVEVRLIDAARVKGLPGWPLRRRWVVKDLAQLWYSMGQSGQDIPVRAAWLESYGRERKLRGLGWLRLLVQAKARRIARHDRNLRRRQPGRNISLPSGE